MMKFVVVKFWREEELPFEKVVGVVVAKAVGKLVVFEFCHLWWRGWFVVVERMVCGGGMDGLWWFSDEWSDGC